MTLRIFNMEITARCSRCKTECDLVDIWTDPEGRYESTSAIFGEKLMEAIRAAWIDHMKRDDCQRRPMVEEQI